MRTIQSQYTPFDQMSMGTKPYGAQVLKEHEPLKNVRYALIEHREFKSYPRPKCVKTYSVTRFELDVTEGLEYWKETSSVGYTRKSEALKVYNCTPIRK